MIPKTIIFHNLCHVNVFIYKASLLTLMIRMHCDRFIEEFKSDFPIIVLYMCNKCYWKYTLIISHWTDPIFSLSLN